MRRLFLAATLLMLGAAVSFAATRSFTGQIMDAPCAKAGNHDAGYSMTGTHTPKDCTLACVKGGAKFVLYDAATKTIYQLDNQTEPRAYAGEEVNVMGTLNRATETIHVRRIEAAR